MNTEAKKILTVETTVAAPVETVWNAWTEPAHITKWCSASPEWHVPRAENDLKEGGQFSTRMEAKDGSMGFDFSGKYDTVIHHERIAYTMDDNRTVTIQFKSLHNQTTITESFEPEAMNSLEMQQAGWQAILDNFKNYTEQL